MGKNHIDSFAELAERTGLQRWLIYERMKAPETIRAFELAALDRVLHFSDADLAKLARGIV